MRDMKESGIEGIDLVPESWDRVQLEHCAYIIRGGSPRPIEQYMSDTDEGYSWIKIGDTEKGNKYITHVREKIISAGLSKTRYVKEGTLLLTNSMSFGEPYILKVNGCIHDGWLAFSNLKLIDKEFLYYFLVSPACRVQFEKASDGGVVQNLNIDKVKHSIIYFPDISEQHVIANYLDFKCAEIDALSADIQSEIETLEAYKRSVITEAVTKGLDKNVQMKDSGIEWIGEIPATWDFVRGKYHLSNKKYIPGIHADEYERLSLTLQGVLPRSKDDAEGLQPKDFYTYQLLKKGELVFKLIDLQNVATSRVGLSHDTGLVSPAYIVLHGDNEVLTEYLQYFYLMMWHRQIFNALGDNGVRSNLNATDLLNVKIPVPPLDEQKRIAGFLNAKCVEIESVIAQKQEQLAVLAEYKKSVIYEYVTGKKEVPYEF